jgi:hypothetical protein
MPAGSFGELIYYLGEWGMESGDLVCSGVDGSHRPAMFIEVLAG